MRNSSECMSRSVQRVDKLVIKSTMKKLDSIVDEINKEKANHDAWKNMFVPPYFESEWGRQFLMKNNSLRDTHFQTSENYFERRSSPASSDVNEGHSRPQKQGGLTTIQSAMSSPNARGKQLSSTKPTEDFSLSKEGLFKSCQTCKPNDMYEL